MKGERGLGQGRKVFAIAYDTSITGTLFHALYTFIIIVIQKL